MTTKLTQSLVNRARDDHPPGTQLHDAEVSGLRLVVGKTSSSFKIVGRLNDGSKRYVSVILGRTDELSLKTARDEATKVRLSLRRGIDPHCTVGVATPALESAVLGHCLQHQPVDLERRTLDGAELLAHQGVGQVVRGEGTLAPRHRGDAGGQRGPVLRDAATIITGDRA